MIQLTRVSKRFPDGTPALTDLSLTIGQGEFISVIGRSGAGKSTLLHLINATIYPSEGDVEVLGHHFGKKENIVESRDVRKQVAFVFQQFNLIKTHTVLSNVLMGRLGYMSSMSGLLGLFSQHDKELAEKTLVEVGLKDQIHKRADQLSGGQQQRVAIARAMVQEPKIILADEPMASLDPKLAEVVLELLYRFNQEHKITVLINVHVLDLAKKRADRILGLKKGHLVFDGAPSKLTTEAVSEVYGD